MVGSPDSTLVHALGYLTLKPVASSLNEVSCASGTVVPRAVGSVVCDVWADCGSPPPLGMRKAPMSRSTTTTLTPDSTMIIVVCDLAGGVEGGGRLPGGRVAGGRVGLVRLDAWAGRGWAARGWAARGWAGRGRAGRGWAGRRARGARAGGRAGGGAGAARRGRSAVVLALPVV